MTKVEYNRWLLHAGPGAGELAAMAKQSATFSHLPRFGMALVIADADEIWIKSTLDSVLEQIYPYLELGVCDNGSARPHVRETLEEYAAADGRVKVRSLPEKESLAGAYNAALSLVSGEFVALLGAGDRVAAEALFSVVEFLQHVDADVIYTDEDLIDVAGRRLNPRFKPYWSPDLLLSVPYLGRLCVIRKNLLDDIGGMREGFEGAGEHDLFLRLCEKTSRIHHLPGVLYHRRTLPGGAGRAGVDENTPSLGAVESALARRGESATVGPGPVGGLRIRRSVVGEPKISIIVHVPWGTSDAPLLEQLRDGSGRSEHELIVAGGGREKFPAVNRQVSHPFPARALNLAAAEARGDYLAFVHARGQTSLTDTAGWLRELSGEARRREVGVVGGKLLAPDGRLRHGGSVVEAGWLAGRWEEPIFEDEYYLPLVDRRFNFAAASAAFMMIRKELFEGVGGFDDDNLPTAFYDLDLSFKLQERGLLNVYTPHASMTLDASIPAPGETEIAYMWRRWWGRQVRMLFYQQSPLYTQHLGLKMQTFSILPN